MENQDQDLSQNNVQQNNNPIPSPPLPTPPAAPIVTAPVAPNSSKVKKILMVVALIIGVLFIFGLAIFAITKGTTKNDAKNESTGKTYKIAENKLSQKENTKQINEMLEKLLTAQKEKNTEEMVKLISSEDNINQEYLAKYFQTSGEKISSFEISSVELNTDFNTVYTSYPKSNTAAVKINLTRNTNYIGNQTNKGLTIPVLYNKEWKAIVSWNLIPTTIVDANKTKNLAVAGEAYADMYKAGNSTLDVKVNKVAVFKGLIAMDVDIAITELDSARYLKVIGQPTLQDENGNSYKLYSSEFGSDKSVKRHLYFISEEKKLLPEGISKLKFSFDVSGINLPKIGQNTNYNNNLIDLDL